MSDCLTNSDLHRYHAGELDETAEARVRQHLAQCEKCARRDAELVAEHEDLPGRLKGIAQPDTEATPPGDTPETVLEKRRPEHDTVSLPLSSWAGAAEGDLAVPRRLGSVRLIHEIGRGGMGVVWLGRDQVLDRDVAVKFLLRAVPDEADPHFKQFLDGARAEASLRHPNIVSVQTAGVVSDLPYLVMDYIDGPSLREVVKKVGPMSVATAVRTVSDVASAVSVLHEQGIVHRDLKPANVLLDRDGNVLVTDFGLASLHRRGDQPLWAAGTPAYMAPEAFEGKASPQTDVYALGMMLFELLGGSIASVGGVSTMRARHANEPLPLAGLPEQVPPQLLEVIERATHTQAIFRYRAARQFQRALSESVAAEGVSHVDASELQALVVQLTEGYTDGRSEEIADRTPPTSYFERLSELVSRKSMRSSPSRNVTPSPASTRIDAFDISRIRGGVTCISCGYNLRGLTADNRCPECGEDIARSLSPPHLSAADPAWLGRIARGQRLVNVALPLSPCLLIAVVVFSNAIEPHPVILPIILATIVGWSVVLTIGTWCVTTLGLREQFFEPWRAPRRLARLSSFVAVFVFDSLLIAILINAFEYRDLSLWIALPWALVMATAVPTANVAYPFHLAGLARRIPDDNAADRLEFVGRWFGLATGGLPVAFAADPLMSAIHVRGLDSAVLVVATVTGFLGLVGVVGWGILALPLMSRCRRGFRRCFAESSDRHATSGQE